MKVILKGPKSCQWNLGEGFHNGGTEVELTDKELNKAEKDKLIECYIDVKQKHKGRFVVDKKNLKSDTQVLKEEGMLTDQPVLPGQKWTEDSLIAIAEESGISGLREIGDKLGVKFRRIDEGILEILEAQNAK